MWKLHNKSVFTFEAEIKNSSAERAEAAVKLINAGSEKFLKVLHNVVVEVEGVTRIKLNLSQKGGT